LSIDALQKQGVRGVAAPRRRGSPLFVHRMVLALSALSLALVLSATATRAQSFHSTAPFAALVDFETGATLF
jgi:hypothetical protein